MKGENAGLPEHFPNIQMDVGYSKLVDEIDVDIEGVSEFLVSQGFSNKEIDETKITFTTEAQQKIGSQTSLATYDPTTKTINLGSALFEHPKKHKFSSQKSSSLKNILPSNGIKEYEDPEHMFNVAMRHELEHRVSHNEDGMQAHLRHRQKHIAKLAIATALWFGVSYQANKFIDKATGKFSEPKKSLVAGVTLIAAGMGYQSLVNRMEERNYTTNPEEIRAYRAEAEDPRNFVNLTMRSK